MPGDGPLLSAGHLVRLDDRWQVVGQSGAPSQSADEVFNLVLDHGHVIEVDGAWCATLLHDEDERRGQSLVQALQRTRGWESGYVEMADVQAARSELMWEGYEAQEGAAHVDRHPHSAAAHAEQASLIAQLRSSSSQPLDAAFVRELHRTAMSGSGLLSTLRSGPQEAVITGSPQYVCPPAAELPRLLDAFCGALDRACEAWAPLNAAALALWAMCYLHLFSDGNGRTARGLSYAVLVRTGAAPLSAQLMHSFHDYFRQRFVRRRYFETLQATTDSLRDLRDPAAFPEAAFVPMAALVAAAARVSVSEGAAAPGA